MCLPHYSIPAVHSIVISSSEKVSQVDRLVFKFRNYVSVFRFRGYGISCFSLPESPKAKTLVSPVRLSSAKEVIYK